MNEGAKQAGGFSYPHTLKLYKCPGENVAGTSRDFTTFVPHWPHYVGNFTDSFQFYYSARVLSNRKECQFKKCNVSHKVTLFYFKQAFRMLAALLSISL
jgi:hypothetical protein